MGLIETKRSILALIREAEEIVHQCGKTLDEMDDYLAEFLTANGVIVLPCKIGEKLYDCGEFFCEDCSCPEIYELEDDEMTIHKRPHDYGYRFTYDGMYIGHEDIGNHIFRTREEAALKGGEG